MPKVHFITQGCSANVADSEVMQGMLKKDGFELVDDEDSADIVVYNTCTVKGPTETKFRRKMQELEEKNKKVVLAGCIPQSEQGRKKFEKHTQIGTYQVHNIRKAVDSTLQGDTVQLLERKNSSRLNLPKVRAKDHIEIVPISHGCKSACTFCKTKHARGDLYSYKPEEIVRHISKAVKEGAKEVWLTSQDSSAYGMDIGTDLAKLLKSIVSIDRDFKLRVGMANPKYFDNFMEELLEVYKNDKIYKFLHVPVQSGSDKVLRDMKRDHGVGEYKEIVKRFRKEFPRIQIMTDIICGFPTETEEDFEKTLQLVKETEPDAINISRFWPRPGTPAERMKQLDGSTVKERSRQLTELFHKISRKKNEEWIGWKGGIIIQEKGKYDGWIGKNYAYKQVVVKKGEYELGERVNIEIVDADVFWMKGKVIR